MSAGLKTSSEDGHQALTSKPAPFSPHRQFADNLRALCTQHGSIAAVCRALGMNRQQFNKYLSGSTLPNGPTLQKICSFFAVDPSTLFHGQDGQNATLPAPFNALGALSGMIGRMRQSTLRPGCYHFYYPWERDAGKCVRAALFVYRKDGSTLFTRFTKLRILGRRQRYYLSGRHDGVVLDSDNGKFLLALNRKGHGELSMVTLGAEHALNKDFMSGLALVMDSVGRPLALRATLEYRGASSLLRRTIAESGILSLSDPGIREEVRQSLSQAARPDASVLSAYSLLDSLPGDPRREGAA